MIEAFCRWWCLNVHGRMRRDGGIMLPLNGHYICRHCFRVYPAGYR